MKILNQIPKFLFWSGVTANSLLAVATFILIAFQEAAIFIEPNPYILYFELSYSIFLLILVVYYLIKWIRESNAIQN